MFGVVSVVPGGGGDGGGGGGVDGDKTLCTVCTGIGLSVLSTWQSEATMEAIVGGDSLLLYLGIVGHGGD